MSGLASRRSSRSARSRRCDNRRAYRRAGGIRRGWWGRGTSLRTAIGIVILRRVAVGDHGRTSRTGLNRVAPWKCGQCYGTYRDELGPVPLERRMLLTAVDRLSDTVPLGTPIDRVDGLGLKSGAGSTEGAALVHGTLEGIILPAENIVRVLPISGPAPIVRGKFKRTLEWRTGHPCYRQTAGLRQTAIGC
jgi:hypothetical protein